MNSKERVFATLNGFIPDRVPIGECAIDFDTVEKIIGHETYLRAKAKSKIAFWEGRHEEVAESYAKDHIELHKKLSLDILTFAMCTWEIPPPTDDFPPRKINSTTWEDKYGRIYKYSNITGDITCVKDPILEQKNFSLEEFQKKPEKPVRNELYWRVLDTVIQEFKDEKFICGPSGGEIGIVLLGGMEKGLMLLIEKPELVKAATFYNLQKQNLADEIMIHPNQDACFWGNDFGHKSGPFISPEMFKEFFLEANKERVANIHNNYKLKVMKHCCGNNWALLDYFIDIGYDCYQSIQPTANMDICKVKERYGDKLTLWGGVAVEHLVSGDPGEVREDVRRAMECGKKDGKFILGSSHSIAVGTKYENYMAMLDEYDKLASY